MRSRKVENGVGPQHLDFIEAGTAGVNLRARGGKRIAVLFGSVLRDDFTLIATLTYWSNFNLATFQLSTT
jgi:hypothetical protein